MLDDAGVISPNGDDAGLISVVGTHLFVLVLTDDAGGIFFEYHGSSVPPDAYGGLRTSPGRYHGSSVPPDAYDGLRTSPGWYHGSLVPPDAYDGPGISRDSGDDS